MQNSTIAFWNGELQEQSWKKPTESLKHASHIFTKAGTVMLCEDPEGLVDVSWVSYCCLDFIVCQSPVAELLWHSMSKKLHRKLRNWNGKVNCLARQSRKRAKRIAIMNSKRNNNHHRNNSKNINSSNNLLRRRHQSSRQQQCLHLQPSQVTCRGHHRWTDLSSTIHINRCKTNIYMDFFFGLLKLAFLFFLSYVYFCSALCNLHWF